MKRLCALLILLVLGSFAAFAQATDNHNVVISVVSIAVIDLSDTADVTFTTTAPALPGDDPGPAAATPATDAGKRLWYTVCNLAATTKKITITTDAAAPAGTQLSVQATPEAGAGTGSTLNISAVTGGVDLVTAIPSVATGRTGADGTGLTYSFWVNAPGSLEVGAGSTINVLYTITNS